MSRRLFWWAMCGCLVFSVIGVDALKRFQQPSKTYAAGVRIYNIPPSTNRKYVGVEAQLTREDWPGRSTLAGAASLADTALVLPVGAGDLFPLTGGSLSAINPDGTFEFLTLVARTGDVLTVIRGVRRPAIPLVAGAVILLRDLVTVTFEATPDGGVTWQRIGAATSGGGVDRRPDGSFRVFAIAFGWTDAAGNRIAKDGDTRVVITNRVALSTALTLDMIETTDF